MVRVFLKSHKHHSTAKNKKILKITVSVFRCTFEPTAVLWKKVHLFLHCYTLSKDTESNGTRCRGLESGCKPQIKTFVECGVQIDNPNLAR